MGGERWNTVQSAKYKKIHRKHGLTSLCTSSKIKCKSSTGKKLSLNSWLARAKNVFRCRRVSVLLRVYYVFILIIWCFFFCFFQAQQQRRAMWRERRTVPQMMLRTCNRDTKCGTTSINICCSGNMRHTKNTFFSLYAMQHVRKKSLP